VVEEDAQLTANDRLLRLHRKLDEVLGSDEARTLMDELRVERLTKEDLRRELEAMSDRLETRMDSRLEILEERSDRKLAELNADLLHSINEQTKTLFRAAVVSNAASVLAVGGLALGAARLA
jgi:arsenate reductase-like glutaredoxin family protein